MLTKMDMDMDMPRFEVGRALGNASPRLIN